MAEILIIEDNETMREGIAEILSRAGHDVQTARSGDKGIEFFRKMAPDFVITDLKMEGLDGLEVLRQILAFDAHAVVMVITAFGTIEIAVDAMRAGAFDFITKPFPPELLRAKVAQALDVAKLRAENRFFRAETGKSKAEFLLGDSPRIREIKDQIARAAPADSTVLVTGESGTGKDLIARALHAQSPRSVGPFIKTDCSALAENLLESELFGHEKGAFTGAIQRKQGRFELADKGTLFLDEIGELPLALQTKLLRVLQERTFERVGGTRPITVDARVVAATNRDLEDAVRRGTFREDLYYRLNIIPIRAPALRERASDIPILVDHFLDRHRKKSGRAIALDPAARAAIARYPWPGNVRELENLIERLSVLSENGAIGAGDLPDHVRQGGPIAAASLPPEETPLEEALESLERRMILRAYEKAGGVKQRTAELLGIKPSALYYKLEKYGIDKPK